jgi:hypothetical protein
MENTNKFPGYLSLRQLDCRAFCRAYFETNNILLYRDKRLVGREWVFVCSQGLSAPALPIRTIGSAEVAVA